VFGARACITRLVPSGAFSSNGSIEIKAVAFQPAFGNAFLYYTFVKFNNQVENEAGIERGNAGLGGCALAATATIRSIEGIRRSGQDFWSGRFVGCSLSGPSSACGQRLPASLTRAGFPRACFPKTVSSTRPQYASMTFVFSADSPLVTCISGPSPESVAVRLTIM